MKKLSILLLAMLFCFACSSGKSEDKEELNDSDKIEGSDSGTTNDSDKIDGSDTGTTNDSDTEEKDDSDSHEAVSDTDTANDSDPETNDSEPVAEGGCDPNPCDTEENRAAHKSRCMPENEGTAHSCVCDAYYYSYDGLCCPAHSSNQGGKCQCDKNYVETEENPGKCVAECSENTIEGLYGYCPKGSVCQQGLCIIDRCAGHTCPENSTCSTKNDEAFCQCDDPLQMSNGKCCPQNSTNVNGTCKCNTGYELSGEKCVATADNKCKTEPCSQFHNSEPNKNKCVPDTSEKGYHCECNINYKEDSDGKCYEIAYDVCPNDMQCLRGYCLPQDLSKELCIKDSDCQVNGGNAICNAKAAGGICQNCQSYTDCPGDSQCKDFGGMGTCNLICKNDDSCPYGKCYDGTCGLTRCYSNEDCFTGTICIMSDSDYGYCKRAACKETACSDTNPHGRCPNANEACINGSCVSGCSPNPCKGTNRTCEIKLGVPTCVCVEGTEEKNGKCQPKVVQSCPNPSKFTCKNKFCTNSNDPAFFCAENSDCGSSMTCTSPSLPSGQCKGCTVNEDCPGGEEEDSAVSCLYGYCMRSCLTDDECNDGMICNTNAVCASKNCSKPSDCPANYTCKPSSTISENDEIVEIGVCSRIPCE